MATENHIAMTLERPPMYVEACAEADRYEITSPEGVERVRQSLCYREFMRRTQWMRDALVKHHPAMIGMEPTPEYLALEQQIHEMIRREGVSLGLSFDEGSPG